MTQPNEQLIATAKRLANAKYWPMEDVEKVPDILRALLEENKRLTQEIESHGPEGRNYTNEQYVALRLELEQVKAERDMWNEAYSHADAGNKAIDNLVQSLHTELAAKDKVLEWYEDTSNYRQPRPFATPFIEVDCGHNARKVLSSYPPREKGADNER